MPPFRPPRERIDQMAQGVLKTLQESSAIQVKKPEEVLAVFRALLTENLQQEHALEEEVFATLKAHGQQIYEHNADFQKMLLEGKKILAKKKSFTL